MRLLLTAAIVVLGQVTVPALRPGEWVIDPDEVGVLVGQVIDPVAGGPVAGMPVRLSRPRQAEERSWPEPWVAENVGSGNEQLGSVATDADGRFAFRGLRPGLYRVRAAGALRATASAEAYVTPEERSRQVTIEVEVGAEASGIVLDHLGRPLADYPVRLIALDVGDGLNSLPNNVRYGQRTAPDGHFHLEHLPTGTVYIQATSWKRGYSEAVAVAVRSGGRVDGLTLVVPDETEVLEGARDGAGGIGVKLTFTPRGPVIESLLDGMSADEAGLLQGDLLAALDGRGTRFMSGREFVARCKGPVGSTVTVRVLRGDESIEVALTRQVFPPSER